MPWWQTWFAVIPGLLLCLPVGLIGLWNRPSSTNFVKGTVTAGFAALVFAIALASSQQESSQETEPVATDGAPSQTPTTTPISPSVPTAPPAPAKVAAPALAGRTLNQATRELEKAGLSVGEVELRYSRRPPGTVLRQLTRPGTTIAEGSTVALIVAKAMPQIPDVVGQPRNAAIRALEVAGFAVRVVEQTVSAGSDNVVLSQNPGGGARQMPGHVVELAVSNLVQTFAGGGGGGGNCTPGYRPCLTPASDYDCAGGSGDGPEYAYGPVYVDGADPYDLDRDGDGVACET
jgi:hypothetical protein